MTYDLNHILVPIRFPLTGDSRTTLEYASRVASENDASLQVLHVDLFYSGAKTRITDIRRAVRPHIGENDYSVSIRRGFLVEEIILDEMSHSGAEMVVLGEQKKPWWRRQLSRAIGNDPALPSFLNRRGNAIVEIAGDS